MPAFDEANKTSGRVAIFGAVSTIVTYFLILALPNLPTEVQGAILVLVLAALAWVDSYIHNSEKIKLNGLIPF